jgi:hypothetical protein
MVVVMWSWFGFVCLAGDGGRRDVIESCRVSHGSGAALTRGYQQMM